MQAIIYYFEETAITKGLLLCYERTAIKSNYVKNRDKNTSVASDSSESALILEISRFKRT